MVPRLAAFPKGFFTDLVERRMTLTRWLDIAAGLGVDGVEMYPRFLSSLERGVTRSLRAEATARGLAIPMMCHSPDFTIPEAEGRAAEVARSEEVIAATADLGGKFCRVLSGQNRPGLDPEKALGWVTASIESLLPVAARHGVTLVIENHYKDGLWEYPEFAQGRDRFLAILRAVPALKVQYDPSNAVVAGEDPYGLLAEVLPRVATMHASDRYLEGGTVADLNRQAADPVHGYARILKHGVVGRGFNDYDRIFGALAGAGFAGWVSIEDGEAPTEQEGTANLKASASFLRAKLAAHFGAANLGAAVGKP
jgi:sugar phosphate isomerase/epimerase